MNLLLRNKVAIKCGFSGGIHLPLLRSRESAGVAHSLPTPPMLYVLMQQHDGPPATICVEPGQEVQAGQLVGRSETPGSMNVHAPLAGRVVGITRADSARWTDVPAVQIETTCESTAIDESSASSRVDPPSLDALIAAADAAGLIDFQPLAGNLADVLREAGRREVKHLIVNTLVGEPIPYAPTIHSEHELGLIIRSTQWLAQAIKAGRTWIAVDTIDQDLLARAQVAARKSGIRIASLANKYPQHKPSLLAATIARRETPPGGTTLDVGVLVLEWQAVLAMWAPIAVTHRDISISGPGINRPGSYRVPIGTTFEHLLLHAGLDATVRRVIEGGPLTGRAVSHLGTVTTRQTSAMLVLDRDNDHVASPSPCIRCGWCQEDCPVGLDPQAILDLAERGQWKAVKTLQPRACVECGLCSYVCPAELPLAEYVIRAKRV